MTTTVVPPSTDTETTPDGGRGGRRFVLALAVVVLALAAGAISFVVGDRESESAVPLVDVVSCSVWTRPNNQQEPTSAGELRIDWGTASKAEGVSSEETASGDGLTLLARYSFPYPPEGHTLVHRTQLRVRHRDRCRDAVLVQGGLTPLWC
jgi:hypothetical protein